MNRKPNEQYNVATANSLPIKIAGYQRRRMYEHFMEASSISPEDTILDIGVTSERSYDSSNYFEKWYPFKDKVTAAGLDDAQFLEKEYPGMVFVKADGRDLPFADNAFDYVHSSAVIEHVGSMHEQARFVSECFRVARKGVYITTPNRWFPIEFHTVAPLVHWLPPTWFRALMRWTGREFFACESNLNLLSARTLMRAVQYSNFAEKFSARIDHVRLAGWPSNLLLIAKPNSHE